MTLPRTERGLGVSEAELAWLVAQCEIHRGEAAYLLDRIGLAAGWRAIDLDCGPLGILDLLVQRIGPTGSVVGLDHDDRMLAAAARTVAERLIDPRWADVLQLVPAAVESTGLPTGDFDLVHERLVLNNVRRPDEVLTEMVRLARPGGWVAVEDVDWISWTCEPAHPAWGRLAGAVASACVGDVYIGRRLPAMLREAGLLDVQVAAHTRVWRPGEAYQKLLIRLAGIYRDRILALGAMGEGELDRCMWELDAHLGRPETYTLYATLFQAWGRKPRPR
jgi:SAM-dependent methyltransferase